MSPPPVDDTTSIEDETTDTLSPGDLVLDRYRVEERIAMGGHSLVFRGVDERLSRPVCIKTFNKSSDDQGVWATIYEHFVQEAFALSKLSHPNTLRIYDFGYLDESGPVQVSEYMAGGTLSSLVRKKRRLSAKRGLPIICKLADALAEAHALGIVHRDIKPQNILFTTEGDGREPKLADFGIAKSVTEDNVANQAGDTRIVAGFALAMYSPSWAAPEQLCGASASPLADVYSLGLITIFSLTGKVICASKSTHEGYEIRRRAEELARNALNAVDIEEEVVDLLVSSVAFDKERRPADARVFAQRLRDASDAPLPKTSPVLENLPPRDEGTAASARQKSSGGALPLPPPPSRPVVSVVAEGTDVKREAYVPPPQHAAPSASFQGPVLRFREQISQALPGRECLFVMQSSETVVLEVAGKRLQLSTMPLPGSGRSLIVKGLSTFVARVGGRPTSAVHINHDGVVDLVDPRQQRQGSVRVSFGQPAGDAVVFEIDGIKIALGRRDFPNVILVDNASQRQCHFLCGSFVALPTAGTRSKQT